MPVWCIFRFILRICDFNILQLYLIVIFNLTLFNITCFSQSYSNINYTNKDGLVDNSITGICQDSRGFFWISTQNGISRFDGIQFKSFSNSQLANSNEIAENTRIFFEADSNRIILTLGNGHLYELNTIYPALNRLHDFKNREVNDVCKINSKTFIVGCIDTLFVTNHHFEIVKFYVPPTKQKNKFWKAVAISKNQLIVSSWNENFLLQISTGKMQEFKFEINPLSSAKSGLNLLYVDTINRWAFYSHFYEGLLKIDIQGKIIHRWSVEELKNRIEFITPSPISDSLAWICGSNGVMLLNKYTHKKKYLNNGENVYESVEGLPTHSLYFDKAGKLWCTSAKGLYVQFTYPTLHAYKINVTDDEPAQTIFRAKDKAMYISKYFGGIWRIDPNTKKEEKFLPKILKNSWFIFESGDSLIQGGKGTSLMCYSKAKNTVVQNKMLANYFPNSELIVSGFRHSDGSLWFSGNVGGGLIHLQNGQIYHYSKSKDNFTHSYLVEHVESKNGDLWFSNNKSTQLLHWIKNENRFEEIDFYKELQNHNLFQSVIHCLAIDSRDNIWIGFDGSGIVNYNTTTKKWTNISKKDGLPSNYIYSLVFDGNARLWVGTLNGLACLEPASGKINVFNHKNGFPSTRFDNQCNFYDTIDKRLWIGASNQLISFNTDSVLNFAQRSPSLYIDEMAVNNILFDIGSKLTHFLSPQENNIRIKFVTLHGGYAGEVIYSYSLDGKAGPWVNLGTSNQVYFPNLKHGEYEFMLRAKIVGSDDWFYLQEPLKFSIATPWFKSLWFIIIIATSITGVLFYQVNAYYGAKEQKQRNILEKQLAVQNERERISFDMHDDIGSGLTQISYLSQAATNRLGKLPELDKIWATSLELVNNMSELIWAMKSENDDLVETISYLKRYSEEYIASFPVQLIFKLPEVIEKRTVAGEKRRHLFLAFKEALHNAIKHSRASKLEIRIQIDNILRIEIEDNGCGFDISQNNAVIGNGLKTMRMRSEKLNGAMQIRSNLGKGTCVCFELTL